MKIISHRGLWKQPHEQNTKGALELSLSSGFGVETDIRDFNGSLVISHDIADKDSLSIDDYFEIIKKYDENSTLKKHLNSKKEK